MAEATQAALLRLYRGLGQRELMRDDPRGRAIVDRKLLPTLDALARAAQATEAGALSTPPPRRIAVAMALAIYSQPHLGNTFAGEGAAPLGVEPLVVSNEVLENALGLSSWELDDLREEVDRRAGGVLKQTTMVQWLLSRYEAADRVFHLLFPGVDVRGDPELLRRGSNLYAVIPQGPVARASLYLPWERTGDAVMPLEAFRGRYVDAGLKRALARGIGQTEGEVIDLLERTIALLPREGLDGLLAHDGWRHRGLASVTGVGQPYSKLSWLGREVDASDVRWQDWIQVDEVGARLREPVAALEGLARHRVHHALEALHTDLLARRLLRRGGPREDDDLEIFDVGRHVRAVLDPLVRWTRNKGSATWLARAAALHPDQAGELLAHVGALWSERIEAWTRPAPEDLEHGPLGKWIGTLAAFDGALEGLLARHSDPRWDHRDLVVLFAGHYLSEVPVDRSLMVSGLDPACPGLALGRWFWPTWLRLLDALDQEAATTNPEFVIPDGLF